MIKLIVKVYFFLFCVNSFSQTTYTWSSVAATSSWNTNSNWIPIGIPQSTDNVVIVNSINSPVLSGNTSFNNFTMTSGSIDLASSNLTINGTAIFTSGTMNNGSVIPIGASAVFDGTIFNVTVFANCIGITLSGSVFNNITTIEKNGSGNNTGSGGCVFNGITTISNSGSAFLRMGNSFADIFNRAVTFTNSNSSYIDIGYGAGTTQLNDNVILNSLSGTGIRFGQGSGLVSVANGKTITIGTFTSGRVEFRNFTQIGSEAQNLNLTGNSAIYFETNTIFNGSLTAISPQILLNGSTFNGPTYIEKTGVTNNIGLGGNTFESITTLKNSSAANFISGNTGADIFNGPLSLICTNSGRMYLSYVNGTTQINDNVDVSSTGSGGIYFGNSTGLATLANGKTITIGASGFSGSGVLSLRNFTQIGEKSQTLILTGTSTLTLGSSSIFNGNVTFFSPQILLNGCTYNGSAYIEKTGSLNNTGSGGNVFSSVTTLKNSGTGSFITGNTLADIFNGLLSLICTNSGRLHLAYVAGNTQINDNVDVSSVSTGGIYFGNSSGLTTLANGKTITIGTGGFSGSGILLLKNFTQNGTVSQNLILTGTSTLIVSTESLFNGNVTFLSPQILLNGCTFNSTAILEKTGASNNFSNGSNVFNATTIIKNSGSGNMYLANFTSDDFNASVTFLKVGGGALFPAYNSTCTFSGDISTVGCSTAITFASNGGGRVEIDGGDQTFLGVSTQAPIIKRLTISGGGNLTLFVPIDISAGGDLFMENGKIITTSTNILTLLDESVTATLGNINSYINGPMAYTMTNNGSSVLNFPLGKDSDWRPIVITPIHNGVTSYTYTSEVINSSATSLDYTLPLTIDNVSDVRYWIINRSSSINANLTSATVQLYYGTTILDDRVIEASNLRIVKTLGSGTDWFDIGGVGSAIGNGSITSSSFTSFGIVTLGFINPIVPLPISLVSFTGEKVEETNILSWVTSVEFNNDYFTIERSTDGVLFEELSINEGAGNFSGLKEYSVIDRSFPAEINYYRLKQTDFDGKYSYSNLISIDNRSISKSISKIINLLGIEVNENYKGLVIIFYSDSSESKIVQNGF